MLCTGVADVAVAAGLNVVVGPKSVSTEDLVVGAALAALAALVGSELDDDTVIEDKISVRL